MLLVRILFHIEAALTRACFAMRAYRIERSFSQAAKNAGIDSRPGSVWDDLTKPVRLELQHLGLPA